MNQKLKFNGVDKSTWSNGPWKHELDAATWIDNATKLPCKIQRSALGHLCGYVGVTKEHPAYDCDYYSTTVNLEDVIQGNGMLKVKAQLAINKIEVHGGLTWANRIIDEDQNIYWFGFDCAHSNDFCPATVEIQADIYRTYRTFDYVKEQCEKLARQILEITY